MSANIFFIKFSEIVDRLDPLFHIGMENIKVNIVKKAKYESYNLHQLCTINRGRFGHRPRNDPKFYGGKYPFIQTGDIVNASINNSQIEYKQTLNELGLKTSKLFEPPKLLFTIAANIGDTAILDYSSCFPDSIVALIPKDEKLKIEYLNIYFKIIKPFIVALAPFAAQKNLNNQQLSEIPIISPPINIQNQIILKMEQAYKRKKQKEQEAKDKLDSIGKYLFEELEIKPLSDKKENLEGRVFLRKWSEIVGDRFDPIWQLDVMYSISGGKYENKYLYQLANVSKGQSITSADVIPGEYPVIAGGQSSPYSHNKYNQKENVITVSASGAYAGYVWHHNYKIFASDCSIIRSKNEKDTMTEYLAEVLRLKQSEIYKLQQGAGQPHVYSRDLEKLLIPIPLERKKQLEIVSNIQAIRNEAEALKNKAIQIFEDAKKEVEAMLLGETDEI